MASKQEQAVKNLNVENTNQENDKKDEKEQGSNKGEPLALPLEAGKCGISVYVKKERVAGMLWILLSCPIFREVIDGLCAIWASRIFRSVVVNTNSDKKRKDL
ncbi:hypothetical protein HJG60_012209 [Phyllostomus discolor]|uniref:Uncharacterized protein n=1 Tax=Phyllostomus discolor TaxID=89673 RepID=A0A833ZE51_9CHIR|nr:hypothetical protein HJG60_012209 [Phyllostomus discolor]